MIKNILSEFKHLKKYKKHMSKIVVILASIFIVGISISHVFGIFLSEKEVLYVPLNTKTLETKLNGNIYFNNEPQSSILTDLIEKVVSTAKESIDICMYSFDNQNIIKTLKNAQKRGIEINIILPENKKIQHDQIFSEYQNDFNIINIGNGITDEHMHHKFIIIDKNTQYAKLITGSINYTQLQEKYDPGFLFETEEKQIIESFIREYNILSKNIRGTEKFRENNYQPFAEELNFSNGFFETWFGPGFKSNSIKERILNLIKEAKTTIDVLAWQFTDKDIANALVKQAKKGVTVRIIADDYYIWSGNSMMPYISTYVKKLNLKNFEIVSDLYKTLNLKKQIVTNHPYFNPYLHHHTLIIDNDKVLTGTNNWSYRGFYRNDENIIISDADFFVEAFVENFEYHYSKLRNTKISIQKLDGKITLLDIPKNTKNIIIYNETSEIEEIPNTCFESEYTTTNSSFSFEVPESCQTKHSILFAFDENKNVVGSVYLDF